MRRCHYNTHGFDKARKRFEGMRVRLRIRHMTSKSPDLARRTMLAALLIGAAAPAMAVPRPRITMFRDAGCDCCLKWAALAVQAGYDVRVVDHPSMPALKQRVGVPEGLWSCHTAMVGRHPIEGHVPIAAVASLLKMGSEGPFGVAVPGMPVGSPGMEVPDGRREPFHVMAFDRNGRSRRFA